MAVGELTNVDVDISDISTSHRLPDPRQTGRTAQRPRNGVRVSTPTATIIVKFASRDVRDLFYRGRKHLYNKSVRDIGVSRSENKIYISESLSPLNKEFIQINPPVQKGEQIPKHLDADGKDFSEEGQRSPDSALLTPRIYRSLAQKKITGRRRVADEPSTREVVSEPIK